MVYLIDSFILKLLTDPFCINFSKTFWGFKKILVFLKIISVRSMVVCAQEMVLQMRGRMLSTQSGQLTDVYHSRSTASETLPWRP